MLFYIFIERVPMYASRVCVMLSGGLVQAGGRKLLFRNFMSRRDWNKLKESMMICGETRMRIFRQPFTDLWSLISIFPYGETFFLALGTSVMAEIPDLWRIFIGLIDRAELSAKFANIQNFDLLVFKNWDVNLN